MKSCPSLIRSWWQEPPGLVQMQQTVFIALVGQITSTETESGDPADAVGLLRTGEGFDQCSRLIGFSSLEQRFKFEKRDRIDELSAWIRPTTAPAQNQNQQTDP